MEVPLMVLVAVFPQIQAAVGLGLPDSAPA